MSCTVCHIAFNMTFKYEHHNQLSVQSIISQIGQMRKQLLIHKLHHVIPLHVAVLVQDIAIPLWMHIQQNDIGDGHRRPQQCDHGSHRQQQPDRIELVHSAFDGHQYPYSLQFERRPALW